MVAAGVWRGQCQQAGAAPTQWHHGSRGDGARVRREQPIALGIAEIAAARGGLRQHRVEAAEGGLSHRGKTQAAGGKAGDWLLQQHQREITYLEIFAQAALQSTGNGLEVAGADERAIDAGAAGRPA